MYFTGSKSKLENVNLCLDLLTVLATFGLSIGVSIEEQKAANTWKDYDEVTMVDGIAISGVCYFTAHTLKSSEPEIAVGAAAIMVGTMGSTAVVQTSLFDEQYRKAKAIRLVGPPVT